MRFSRRSMLAAILMPSVSFFAGRATGQCEVGQRQAHVGPGTNSSDRYGVSVALSGTWSLPWSNDLWGCVGAPDDDHSALSTPGSARVLRLIDDNFVEVAMLIASDPSSGDDFGMSVDIHNDRIIVGASQGDSPTVDNTGAAYVYVRSGETWAEEAKFAPEDGAATDNFGRSVAISDDYAAVGAYFHDGPTGPNSGAVYIYQRMVGGWSLHQKLTPEVASTAILFGQTVDIEPRIVLVGAPLDNPTGGSSGSAYVYTIEEGGGTWSQSQKLTASDGASGARFGSAVKLAGEFAIIGATQQTTGGGKAYIFRKVAGVWTEDAILTPPVANTGAWFGFAVALGRGSGGQGLVGEWRAVVGAQSYDQPGALNAGSAFEFRRSSGGVWTFVDELVAPDASADDAFGWSVATIGDVHLIGAYLDDVSSQSNQGTVREFRPLATPLLRQPIVQVRPEGHDAHFSVVFGPAGLPSAFPGAAYWRRDGMLLLDGPAPGGGQIIGSHSHSLIITDVGPEDEGVYDCYVPDTCGWLFSSSATLTVPPLPGVCPGDADGNGIINFADITAVLATFNSVCP